MSQSNSRIDSLDALILFADLQAGIAELTQTNPPDRLKKAVRALAQLARLFNIPVIVTGIRGEDGSAAKIVPQIGEILGELPTHHRTTCDSFSNQEIVGAIEATGRKTLLISGVATELAVQLPALTASDRGNRVYVVLDACGGMSERTEQAALLRMAKAGATTVSVMTLAGELAATSARPGHNRQSEFCMRWPKLEDRDCQTHHEASFQWIVCCVGAILISPTFVNQASRAHQRRICYR
jgi:nicotinamidase-related amidase